MAIPHYAVTSNIIMAAAYLRINDPTLPWKDRRMRDGDVSLCALPMFRELHITCHLHIHLTDFFVLRYLWPCSRSTRSIFEA